jgi:hypothetical protein
MRVSLVAARLARYVYGLPAGRQAPAAQIVFRPGKLEQKQ